MVITLRKKLSPQSLPGCRDPHSQMETHVGCGCSEKSPSRVKPLKLGDFFVHRSAYPRQGWGSQKSQQCGLESKDEVNQRRQGPLCRAQIYRTTEETRVLYSGGCSSKGSETGKLKAHDRDKKGEMAQWMGRWYMWNMWKRIGTCLLSQLQSGQLYVFGDWKRGQRNQSYQESLKMTGQVNNLINIVHPEGSRAGPCAGWI